jgi:hypothetical protein
MGAFADWRDDDVMLRSVRGTLFALSDLKSLPIGCGAIKNQWEKSIELRIWNAYL